LTCARARSLKQGANKAAAFDKFVQATQGRRQQTSLLDAFASKMQANFTRFYEKKCFFVLWHLARVVHRNALDLVRDAESKRLGSHMSAWRSLAGKMKNARKLASRISGAEEVRQASWALHGWIRWHDRIKMLSAQVPTAGFRVQRFAHMPMRVPARTHTRTYTTHTLLHGTGCDG
jgi:hypothetical protein